MKNFDDYMVLRSNLLKKKIRALVFFSDCFHIVVDVNNFEQFYHDMKLFADNVVCNEDRFFRYFDSKVAQRRSFGLYDGGIAYQIWFV